MSLELASPVRGGFRVFARVVQRTVCGWLFAVVVPAVSFGTEDLVHPEDQAVAVEALAAIDFECLTLRQRTKSSRFPMTSRSET